MNTKSTPRLRRSCCILAGLMAPLCMGTVAATDSGPIVPIELPPIGGTLNLPDLQPQALWTDSHVAVPGESITVHTVIRNSGTLRAKDVKVRVCRSSGGCKTKVLGKISGGSKRHVQFKFAATADDVDKNPHFLTVEVDPNNSIAESDDSNNERDATKPVFVTELDLVAPSQPEEHDEIIQIVDGVVASYERIDYGADGAPSDNGDIPDPLKFQPHPVTGFTENLEPGIPGQPRIDPRVIEADQAAEPGQKLRYIVKYRHNVPMPNLPALPDTSKRFSEENIPVLTRRISMFEAVRRARLQGAGGLIGTIKQGGGTVLEDFTLAGALLVEAPKGMLQTIAARQQVLHVESETDGSPPPDTVADGRDWIESDAYFNSGATGEGYIALLDSGVRNTHTLLTGPDHLLIEEDCVSGNADCNDTGSAAYDPDDDCWDHGTSSAAILTGNSNLGFDTRGVTSSWVDSWKVYPNACGGLNSTAVLRGYDEAIFWGDQIVVAEIQSTQSETGTIAEAADDAFDAGAMTIAANGNYGPGSATVASPANAHKAIGVGNYDVDSGNSISSQSDGPTADNRYKPDIQAPTNTDTASTISSTTINNFGGTSGATPYAAGAASLFADWYNKTATTSANAGKVYAGLINGGPLDWGNWNNSEGVGKFELPLNGSLYTGSRNLTDGDNDYVTINVPVGTTEISVAIWWPENSGNTHRDIDLYLQRPNGTTSASSISSPSVFERIKVTAPITTGNRDIRIYGYSVPLFVSQTVYYAIHVK